jgi:hypothetical protein
VAVRNVRRSAAWLRRRDNERKRLRGNCRKTERFRGRRDEHVRDERAPGAFLVISNRPMVWHRRGRVVTPEVSVQRLTVVMGGFVRIEVDMREGGSYRPRLHEHDERRRGQSTKHMGIVANRP